MHIPSIRPRTAGLYACVCYSRMDAYPAVRSCAGTTVCVRAAAQMCLLLSAALHLYRSVCCCVQSLLSMSSVCAQTVRVREDFVETPRQHQRSPQRGALGA